MLSQVVALFFLLAIHSCQGMALNKDGMNKTLSTSANVKEGIEQKFNHTVEKVVEAKMFLLGALAHTINKTVDKLIGAKHQAKEMKEDIKDKFSSAIHTTSRKWEEMKQNLHDYKLTKATAHQQPTPIVFVTRDFLPVPNVQMFVNDVPTQPLVPFTETSVETGNNVPAKSVI